MFNVIEKNNERSRSLSIVYFFLKSSKNFEKIFNTHTDSWCVTFDKNSEIIYIDSIIKDCKNITHEEFLNKFYFEENCSIKKLINQMSQIDLTFLKQKLNNSDLESFRQDESLMYENGIRLYLEYKDR